MIGKFQRCEICSHVCELPFMADPPEGGWGHFAVSLPYLEEDPDIEKWEASPVDGKGGAHFCKECTAKITAFLDGLQREAKESPKANGDAL